MTTLEKFNSGFIKFKQSKPEWKAGPVSGIQLDTWQNEFLEMRLKEEWGRGMLDAKKIIEETPDSNSLFLDIFEAIDDALEDQNRTSG